MKPARVAFAGVMAAALVVGTWGSYGRAADTSAVNSRRALSMTIRELNVDGQSLGRVMDYLRDVSGTNIVVNWKALESASVMKDSPITMRVRDLPLRKVLQLVLDQASPNAPLTYEVEANVIEVLTQEEADKHMVTKVYIVDDLVMVNNSNVQAPQLNIQNATGSGQQGSQGGGGFGGGGGGGFGGGGGSSGGFGGSGGGSSGGLFTQSSTTSSTPKQTSDQKGQELVDLIKEVIRPNIWKDNGGSASIRYFAGKLIVTAPVSVHEAIGGPVGNASAVRFGM